MKRTDKKELNFSQASPKEYDLNKSPFACAPCLNETLKIKKQIDGRSLNEIKIDEIKKIVKSIFQG